MPPDHPLDHPLDRLTDQPTIGELAASAYRLASAMDIDALAAMLADDVVMDLPFAPEGWPKVHHGKAAVVEFQRRAAQSFASFSMVVDRILATNERIAVLEAHSSGTTTKARPYENLYCTILEFDRAGLITRWTEYYDPSAVLGAFPER